MCYCTVFTLFYVLVEGNFQVISPKGLTFRRVINGGFFVL